MTGLPIFVIALLLAGCGADPEPSVPAAGNVFEARQSTRFGTFVLRVRDQAGLVMAVRTADAPRRGAGDDGVVANPAQNEVTVHWLGGACFFEPTLTVSGTAQDLDLVLRPDAPPGEGGACILVGNPVGFTMTLSEPVEQDAITLEVR